MDLQLKDQLFIVGGATSGFGKAITEQLLQEGARIIAVARGKEKLEALQQIAPDKNIHSIPFQMIIYIQIVGIICISFTHIYDDLVVENNRILY